MTTDDRAKAVAPFGFTPRQARFLALVMRHAGVCLLRQYATFAGIVQGQKTRAFFHKLVSHRHAISYACRHNRAKLYHVHHFALYRAIDEPNSAYRRPSCRRAADDARRCAHRPWAGLARESSGKGCLLYERTLLRPAGNAAASERRRGSAN